MPVRVVDDLEVVEIEVEQAQRPAVAAVAAQLLAEAVAERARVHDPGQRVVDREVLELGLGAADVAERRHRDPRHRGERPLVHERHHHGDIGLLAQLHGDA